MAIEILQSKKEKSDESFLYELTSAVLQNDATNATLKQFFYSYDPAANRTSEQIDTAVTSGTYNSLNQLTDISAGGKTRFQGTLNEPGTVTVGGQPAWMQGGTNFVADVGLTSGTNSIAVVAKDANNNTSTNTYQVIVPGGAGKTLSYDDAGNTTSDGTHTFTWDAASRLVKITYADNSTSEFAYDAFGRRIRITEKDSSGSATSTKQFLWDALSIAEERDASNAVTTRYFQEGFQKIQVSPALTENYFTTRDHLGSVREVVDNTGTLVSRYNYDPFGRITKLSGTVDSNMLYTGHYFHAKSSLSLAPYRAYDAETGRWLSRDPIGESGGINLYGYVSNNPVNLVDPTGEFAIVLAPAVPWLGSVAISGLAALGLWELGSALADASAPEFSDCPGNKPPFTGPPGSTVRGGTGSRTYGDDGYPVRDRDWPHPDHAPPGNGDHSHDWDRPAGGGPPRNEDRSPPREPKPNDPPPPRGPNVPAP